MLAIGLPGADATPTAVEVTDTKSPAQRSLLQCELNYTSDTKAGFHSVRSPLVGSRSDDLLRLERFAQRHTGLRELAAAVHDPAVQTIVLKSQREAAEALSQKHLKEFLAPWNTHGLTPTNAVAWRKGTSGKESASGVGVNALEGAATTWHAVAYAQAESQKGGRHFIPSGVAAIHELMHIQELTPGSVPYGDDLGELMASLHSLVLSDEINKTLKQLPLTTEINYGRTVVWNGHCLPLGRLANTVRELEQKYGGIADAVMSKEFLQMIGDEAIPDNPRDFPLDGGCRPNDGPLA